VAYRDLKEFIARLKETGELKEISRPVDPYLEITEIADRAVKRGGPALLFTNVTGHSMPVLINAFASRRRMELALETDDIDAIAAEIDALLTPEVPRSVLDKLKMIPVLARLQDLAPREVRSGPCQEIVRTEDVSLDELPIITCWPGDGGPYITLGQVFTRHPEKGTLNIGMYRLQKFDSRTLGMHWQRHKGGAEHYRVAEQRGERLEAAIVLGPDPAMIYASTAPLPEEISELMLAGFLRRKPVETVKCVTVDLRVPANSQIVLEGYVEPGERRLEGPFGDHTGFYSLADFYPVFHLTAITTCRDPVYPTTVVGRPPMEDGWLGKATERIFLPLIRKTLPEVVDINLPVEGIFHNFAIVSIRKRYPGHARKVMHALWGLGQMMFTKYIIVLDEHANVHDMQEVIWRLGTATDPRRDIEIASGPTDVLDHAAAIPDFSGKLGFDATRKWPDEGYDREWPEEIVMSPEIKARVDAYWDELGIG
jgi:4-hydroxy-3-polyprenylbenzoate decarboxylase